MKKIWFVIYVIVLLGVNGMLLITAPEDKNVQKTEKSQKNQVIQQNQQENEMKEENKERITNNEVQRQTTIKKGSRRGSSSSSTNSNSNNPNTNSGNTNQQTTNILQSRSIIPNYENNLQWSQQVLETISNISRSGGQEALQFFDTPLAEGCTTAWYRDADCDGYGTAKNNERCYGTCGPTRQGSIGNLQDADDTDPQVNTPQSVTNRYGNPTQNIQNLKNLLARKFGFAINNVYVIAPAAASQGEPNTVNQPYAAENLGMVIAQAQAGDVVLFRAGRYEDNWSIIEIDGKIIPLNNNPLVIAAYPGEQVILDAMYPISIKNAQKILIDGFILTCGTNCRQIENNFWGGQKGIDLGNNNDMIIQNTEITGFRWGVHGSFHWGKTTFDKVVVHGNAPEHGIYSPANCVEQICYMQEDITVKNSLLYNNRRTGYQQNGAAERLNLSNNIIHSNAGAGITFTNGVRDSSISNNLIFNNNAQAIVIWHDNTNDAWQNNENIKVTKNILWEGTLWNGICGDGGDRNETQWVTCPPRNAPSPHDMPALIFADDGGIYNNTGNIIRENILVTQNTPALATNKLGDIAQSIIEQNIFYRADNHPMTGLISTRWGMNAETDGTHEQQTCSPCRYFWSLENIQFNHTQWRDNIRRNRIMNPLTIL